MLVPGTSPRARELLGRGLCARLGRRSIATAGEQVADSVAADLIALLVVRWSMRKEQRVRRARREPRARALRAITR